MSLEMKKKINLKRNTMGSTHQDFYSLDNQRLWEMHKHLLNLKQTTFFFCFSSFYLQSISIFTPLFPFFFFHLLLFPFSFTPLSNQAW